MPLDQNLPDLEILPGALPVFDRLLSGVIFVHPEIVYFQTTGFQYTSGDRKHEGSLNRSPAMVRAGLGAGRIIGPFRQLFETLPQPLPELREGGYRMQLPFFFGMRRKIYVKNW